MQKLMKYVPVNIIIIVTALQIISASVFSAQPDAKNEKAEKNQQRTLQFPKDRSLGRLFISDENFKRVITGLDYHMADVDWKSLGDARGTVKVPAGNNVRLMVYPEAARDLSPLSKLGPNDLYSLTISFAPADDRAMQYVAHLGGLKVLDMLGAPIGDAGMAYVGQLKSLEYLTLPEKITDKGLSAVSKLPVLKGLYFHTNSITNNGLQALSKLGTLEEMELGGDLITDDGLKHIAGLSKLNYLLLWGKFTGSGFKYLKEITSLRIVNLFHIKTTQDAGLEHLAAMPALEGLSLFDNSQISDQGMVYLANSKSLKKINIGETQVTEKGVEYLSKIMTLEALNLPEKGQTDVALESIGRLNKLKVLNLPTAISLKGLVALDKLEELEELSASGPAVNDESIKHIANHGRLKILKITNSGIGDSGLRELAKLQSLERLHLVFNNISLGGLSELNGLPRLKYLEVLNLIDNGPSLDIGKCKELEKVYFHMAKGSVLKDEDLKCLKSLKKLKELQTGHMQAVSDAGLAYIDGLSELEIMTIGGPNVTDAGLEHLLNLKNLWMLNICGNISGDGLQKLNKLKMLNTLNVTSGQNISQKAVDKFKKSMPGEVQVTINYY